MDRNELLKRIPDRAPASPYKPENGAPSDWGSANVRMRELADALDRAETEDEIERAVMAGLPRAGDLKSC